MGDKLQYRDMGYNLHMGSHGVTCHLVVVVVMTSPSGTAYMGDRCPEEMRNSTRLS